MKFAVTGASGYIASFLIKSLLEAGHTVHGTVRSLKDTKKVQHLLSLFTDTKGKLELFEADLLKDGSFKECFQGVDGVFHTASPFQINVVDGLKDLVEPAVNGTTNVVSEAINTPSVKRIVLTSSMASVCGTRQPGHVYTEHDFNDTATLQSPYPFSKVSAELKAWDLIKAAQENKRDLDMITVNPGFVFGPVLSDRDDSVSVNFVRNLCNGTGKEIDISSKFSWIDIRDVVKVHILSMEIKEAKGRYLCCNPVSSGQEEVAKILAAKFPDYQVPTKTNNKERPLLGKYDNQKLVDLIGPLVTMEDCLVDMVESIKKNKLL